MCTPAAAGPSTHPAGTDHKRVRQQQYSARQDTSGMAAGSQQQAASLDQTTAHLVLPVLLMLQRGLVGVEVPWRAGHELGGSKTIRGRVKTANGCNVGARAAAAAARPGQKVTAAAAAIAPRCESCPSIDLQAMHALPAAGAHRRDMRVDLLALLIELHTARECNSTVRRNTARAVVWSAAASVRSAPRTSCSPARRRSSAVHASRAACRHGHRATAACS